MYIEAIFTDERSDKWSEYFIIPDNATDEDIWDELNAVIKQFNATLRPYEVPRQVVNIYEIDPIDPSRCTILFKHDWSKTNLVTKMDGRMSSYDEYKCERCGITGRRYGLGGVVRRDNKYKNEKYESCTPSRR
jgi:hypothetical protein